MCGCRWWISSANASFCARLIALTLRIAAATFSIVIRLMRSRSNPYDHLSGHLRSASLERVVMLPALALYLSAMKIKGCGTFSLLSRSIFWSVARSHFVQRMTWANSLAHEVACISWCSIVTLASFVYTL